MRSSRGGAVTPRQDHRRRARLQRHLVWRAHPQPWNLEEGSSGSSAGSASATAAGLCAFFHRHGDARLDHLAAPALWDHRLPPHLRPCLPRGRHGAVPVARQGRPDLPLGHGHRAGPVGPQCGAIRQIAAPLPRAAVDLTRPVEGMARRLPAGSLRRSGATDVDRAALEAVRRLGLEVVPVTLPDLPYGALINVLYAEAAATFETLTLSGEDDSLTWQDAGAGPTRSARPASSAPSTMCSWTGCATRRCWPSMACSNRWTR